ncbi:glycogen synthase GlgA [Amphibiibacter pelophylacis]|uniref:Glycogen synthase GlgA n=1 Tax=Amphibiibacter pelophylacis TaxID=1799477 RepID=A0ACC6P4P5_9BURK
MRLLQVSAEIYPLLKTGGLADVAGALPLALRDAGVDVRVLLPGFPALRAGLADAKPVGRFITPWGDSVQVLRGHLPEVGGLEAYVLDAPALFDRPGSPYEDAQRQPYGDNHRRFAQLGWAAARLAHGLDASWSAQVVHAHDWHAALAPACLAHWHNAPHVPSVYTVHNLAYQGLFDAHQIGDLGLPASSLSVNGLEFFGRISFMKAGLFYASQVTTVSPTYAREIQTPDQGCGLDGLLRSRAAQGQLGGILNGVDTAVWNPASDPHLPHAYSAGSAKALKGKALCKAALQQEVGLDVDADAPLLATVSRLTEQKGLPLLLAQVDALVQQGAQLLVLGSGDAALEAAFTERAAAHPGRVAVKLGYDEALSHRIFGGSDMTLVPSRFEPCGLTQMYGLRYGSVPVVRRVGGLADTVTHADFITLQDDTATGFLFDDYSADALGHALRLALAAYRRPADWRQIQQAGMRQPLGWEQAAQAYADLYRRLVPQ